MSAMRVEMYIPETPTGPRLRLLADLVAMCGGSTVLPGEGFWIDEQNSLIVEPVQVLTGYTEDTPRVRLGIESIIRAYKEAAEQQVVMYVLNCTEVIYIKE